ncbi:MAG: site-2 protease family protein [Oscillospiraceae bacterium]|nr:site-2 protease family protein [Oscillospiraceae bacterium]
MSVVIAILLMILILGVCIVVHEFGHFIAARICKIKVHEFAIGMGPKLWSKQGKQTRFSLRAIPIGGFCAMGEDDVPTDEGGVLIDDPDAFRNKPKWQRIFVLIFGSVLNFVLGFLILLIISFTLSSRTVPVIEGFVQGVEPAYNQEGELVRYGVEAFQHTDILQEGDRIVSVNGMHLFSAQYISEFLRIPEDGQQHIIIRRDGVRHDLYFEWNPLRLLDEHGQPFLILDDDGETLRYAQTDRFGFYLRQEGFTFGTRLTHSVNRSFEMVQIVTFSIGQLFRGQADIADMAGPVGMVDMVHQVVDAPDVSTGLRVEFLLFFAALIAVNLAVINMLPIPALDGGRVLFILIEAVIRRKIPPKLEGMIHATFFFLLMLLIVFIFFGDIRRIITR